ncbi:MAG TPA: S41 family peptidase, partial [Chitinophagaceae bacterium]|nr:S41 family peptidase [Chitinophagaceae bacterium]
SRRIRISNVPRPSRKDRRRLNLQNNRLLRFDTSLNLAVMDLNTFANGYRLRRFFHSSFKQLKENKTEHLVIDLRANGGGSVTNSNLLTKYISNKRFKIADSLYAIRRSSKFGKYQEDRFANWLFLQFMTHRQKDGHYHFGLFEKKYFKPRRKNHFDKQVYILTGGNTFSASTLFAVSVYNQDNVTVVGEETGGGAYGNNAWLIPEVTLPLTRLRFRLPLFRLVINKDLPKTGYGIYPEVPALPTVHDIRQNRDFKMEKVRALIRHQDSAPAKVE